MRYSIRHVSRFAYEVPITESVMEARMQPRSDGLQRCLHFALTTAPAARVLMYQDHDGNIVHHFNIPARHSRLTLTAEALVECAEPSPLPEELGADAWTRLDALSASGEFWDLLEPSAFPRPTELLRDLAGELDLRRGRDPLRTVRQLMAAMHARFEYAPQSTRVDSPIDDALRARRGVCQDFAHIFIALARELRMPARYVSGYLFQSTDAGDVARDGATHAWVEVLFPGIGWTGLDPTNNEWAGIRHVRVAVGRDYADVPPTRGVFKGTSAVRSELAVAVRVGSAVSTPGGELAPFTPWMSRDASGPLRDADTIAAQQQQQQQ